jgi:hypothetical protein
MSELRSDTDMQILVKTFEQELQRLCERPLDPDAREATIALRDAWSRLVSFAFGAIGRVQVCSWCSRSSVQTGPRCVYCWHRHGTNGPEPQRGAGKR